MKHLDFVTVYEMNQPKGYAGHVINSSYKEKFYFDKKEEFEEASVKFIENNILNLMNGSEEINIELNDNLKQMVIEYCSNEDIEIEEFIQDALIKFMESSK